MFYPRTPFLKNPEVESQVLKRNILKTKELMEWLCEVPKTTTLRVNLKKTTIDCVQERVKNELLKKYSHLPDIFLIPEVPEVLCIGNFNNLEYGNTELLPNLSRKQIIVDTNCANALLRGAHIYAPGVIGMQSGTKKEEFVDVYADLAKKCKMGTNIIYDSTEKIFIGNGIVKMQRHELFNDKIDSKGIAVEMMKTISGVPSLGDYFLSPDETLLQNFPSIVCCKVLDPQPGETVLDMCAAPGNKTSHIAQLMNKRGVIIALDKTESRVKLLREKMKQFQIDSVKCYAYDSTKACDESISKNLIIDSPPYACETFDKILLDAPCSGLGNRPNLVCRLTTKMLLSYPSVQKNLFDAAFKLLKFGGVLVYSTCTVTESENENIVKWALDTFGGFKLEKAAPIFGQPGLDNIGLSDEQRKLLQRFGPVNKFCLIDSPGFFIAKFRKHKPQ